MNNQKKANKKDILLLVIAATLLLFSNGKWVLPIATWISPIFLLRYLKNQKSIKGYIICGIIYSAIYTITWWGVANPSKRFDAVDIIPTVFGSLFIFIYIPYVYLSSKRKSFITTLIFPVTYVVFDFLNILFNPLGDFTVLGYTQYGNLALMQLTSITGILGITFIITWFASFIDWIIDESFKWEKIKIGVTVFSIILASILLFGTIRLLKTRSNSNIKTVRIASITLGGRAEQGVLFDLINSDKNSFKEITQNNFQQYIESTIIEATAGAEIIFWAELGAIAAEEDIDFFYGIAKETASKHKIYLGVPFYIFNNGLNTNKLVIFGPDGNVVMEHIKYGGAFIDGIVEGSKELQTWEIDQIKLSGFICWDMDYPRIVKQAGKQDVTAVIVPSQDWPAINPLHSRMSVFRAIENGFSMVRQADSGLSISVDAYGQQLSTVDHYHLGQNVMVTQVPINEVFTIYPFLGDFIGWISILYLILIFSIDILMKRFKK